MNKEFIPYEQALELEKLGFDEPCFGVYATKDGYVRKSAYDEIGNAPLYQQAFRWFRDKHGLCIVIKPIDDKKLDLGYNLLKNGLIMSTHLTHEEAELECLKKLIELVKNK
jgi:hypothetical protein